MSKPFMTTNELVESIARRISLPLTQNTFMYRDIVAFLNEELQLNAVPSVKELHEEYFVHDVVVPLIPGVNRYPIPDRAIGMSLRDLCYADAQGNYHSMTRLAPEDKAYFQSNGGTNGIAPYYIKGNEIVLSQQVGPSVTGSLIFSIFLRPNQLVRNDRAATITGFQKAVVVSAVSQMQVGDTVSIATGLQSQTPITYVFTAVSGAPGPKQFQIGVSETITAANLASAINNVGIEDVAAIALNSVCTITYADISNIVSVASNGLVTDNANLYVQFDNLPGTYTDPDTDVTESLYSANGKVDFLQTQAGHRTYAFDIKLRQILPGAVGKFKLSDLQTYMNNSAGGPMQICPIKVGDYICLANECIIPQIPPELHTALAERGAARVLSAMGDKDGYAISQSKIQEMDRQQASLIGTRVEGTVRKVFNKNSFLRRGKRFSRGM